MSDPYLIKSKICEVCKKEFSMPYGRGRKKWATAKFCSPQCVGVHLRDGTNRSKICKKCGKEFFRFHKRDTKRWNSQVFCSAECKKTHGKSYEKEYSTWREMRSRCYWEKHHAYQDYGGRGIKVCEGWGSFEKFFNDMGPKGNKTIDRINNNGHYSCGKCKECTKEGWPLNCKWSNMTEQSRNRRSNVYITHNGVSLCISEWAEKLNIPRHRISRRFKSGKYTVEQCLFIDE